MKKMLLVLIIVLIPGVAQASDIPFDKDSSYDLLYQINNGTVDEINNVRILDTIEIEGIPFIVVQNIGLKKEKGYIRFDTIKSILSHGVFKRAARGSLSKNE